jgi:hypothetical protein
MLGGYSSSNAIIHMIKYFDSDISVYKIVNFMWKKHAEFFASHYPIDLVYNQISVFNKTKIITRRFGKL